MLFFCVAHHVGHYIADSSARCCMCGHITRGKATDWTPLRPVETWFVRILTGRRRTNILNAFFLALFPQHISRSVFKGMLEVLRAVVTGFEVTVENHGIGGVASAFQFLEIAHTHYYGRNIRDEAHGFCDDDNVSVISNTESISTLSDFSDMSTEPSSAKRKNSAIISPIWVFFLYPDSALQDPFTPKLKEYILPSSFKRNV